jgi:hypothetical protein
MSPVFVRARDSFTWRIHAIRSWAVFFDAVRWHSTAGGDVLTGTQKRRGAEPHQQSLGERPVLAHHGDPWSVSMAF